MQRVREIGPLLRERHGRPVRRVGLTLGTSCPHRTASGEGGCIFCGEGAPRPPRSIASDLQHASSRLGPSTAIIAYLQDHTATLLPAAALDEALRTIRSFPAVVSIAIGTRPDCLAADVLDVLSKHAASIDLLVELGLQTACDATLAFIQRGHSVGCFCEAVELLHRARLRACAHVILGLPTPAGAGLVLEGPEHAVATARLLGTLGVAAVKLHNCHVLEGTALAELYRRGDYCPPDFEGYLRRLAPFLEHLPASVEVHRLVGEARPPRLLAPAFTAHKSASLQRVRTELEARNIYQGRLAGG